MFDNLRMDLERSRGNVKSCLVCMAFRSAYWAHAWRNKNRLFWIFMVPYLVLYRICVEWLLGIELPHKTKVGAGLRIEHGSGLVINDHSVIGENVTLRHCTTIGNKGVEGPCPAIGNDVSIGSNVVIIGDVSIGDHSLIGAGSVVVKDVPPYSVVVGNPARVVRMMAEYDQSNA